jgi:streptogramin lyase
MYEIFVPKRGPAAGEVFLGTEHGIVRYQGTLMADHRHIATDVANPNGTTSQRFGATKALTVTDDGAVWYGNDFRFGGIPWTPRLYEWYFDAPWLWPSHAFGGETDRDYNEGIGVDSKGDVWVGSRGFGMAHLKIAANKRSASKETLDVPSSMINDLLVDLNDTIWLATDSGSYRYDPVAKSWTRFAGVSSRTNKLYLDDTVTPRAIYFATSSGITVYRGQ